MRLAAVIVFVLPGCMAEYDEPNYFLRPAELAVGQEKCAAAGGLEGMAAKVPNHINGRVQYVAICKDGTQLEWRKS